MSLVDRAFALGVLCVLVAVALSVLKDGPALEEFSTIAARIPGVGSLIATAAAGRRCGLSHDDAHVTSFLSTIRGGSAEGIVDGAASTFGVRSNRVVFSRGGDSSTFVVEPATIVVEGGKVVKVVTGDDLDWAADEYSELVAHILDFGSLVVMPGFVDVHVHCNEPGRGEKEGFRTATLAAAAGGVTTIVDMPLNGVKSTISAAMFQEKLEAAKGKTFVDIAYWGGFVADNTENATVVDDVLRPLLDSGVAGVKAFLNKAGFGFNLVGRKHIENGLAALADAGLPLLVHSELDLREDEIPEIVYKGDPTSFKTFAATKPRQVRPVNLIK